MSNLLAASILGGYFAAAGVWFAWRSNKRKRELAAWSPVRYALHTLDSSPRPAPGWSRTRRPENSLRPVDGRGGAPSEQSKRGGYWLNPRGPLGPASTAAREPHPPAGSRAALLDH